MRGLPLPGDHPVDAIDVATNAAPTLASLGHIKALFAWSGAEPGAG